MERFTINTALAPEEVRERLRRQTRSRGDKGPIAWFPGWRDNLFEGKKETIQGNRFTLRIQADGRYGFQPVWHCTLTECKQGSCLSVWSRCHWLCYVLLLGMFLTGAVGLARGNVNAYYLSGFLLSIVGYFIGVDSFRLEEEGCKQALLALLESHLE